jgi:hypothetical protein
MLNKSYGNFVVYSAARQSLREDENQAMVVIRPAGDPDLPTV